MAKENKNNKTILIILALALLLVGGLAYYFISGGSEDSGVANDKAPGKETVAPVSDSAPWPSHVIPAEFPEYNDGSVSTVSSADAENGPHLVIITNTSETVVLAYIEELKSQGFLTEDQYEQRDLSAKLSKKIGEDSFVVMINYVRDEAGNEVGLNLTFQKN